MYTLQLISLSKTDIGQPFIQSTLVFYQCLNQNWAMIILEKVINTSHMSMSLPKGTKIQFAENKIFSYRSKPSKRNGTTRFYNYNF